MTKSILVLLTVFAGAMAHAQYDDAADDGQTILRMDGRDFFPDRGPGGPGGPGGGGPGGPNNGGPRGPGGPGPHFPDNGGGPGHGPGGGGRPGRPGGSMWDEIPCGSNNGRPNVCQGRFFIVDAFLARQDSRTPCIENFNWSVRGGRIFVDKGCRGTFRVTYR